MLCYEVLPQVDDERVSKKKGKGDEKKEEEEMNVSEDNNMTLELTKK